LAEFTNVRAIVRERTAAPTDGKPFVVFLIGMRVNSLWAFPKWLWVASAMPPMLKELYQHPELGFIAGEFLVNWRGVTSLQYWRSVEELQAYAGARNREHFPAWTGFYRRIGRDGSVGIWHETYRIDPGAVETIYVNMPAWGLSRAFGREPVSAARHTAKQRMQTGGAAGDETQHHQPEQD
jgi:hypothetical protein